MRRDSSVAIEVDTLDRMSIKLSTPRAIVVGAGGIAGAWMPALAAERVAVAAIVDLRREAAVALAEKNGLDASIAHDDLARALAAVPADFVIDLTVPDAHHRVTTLALEAGLPVIGEKPMAATMAQAIDLVRASERTGNLFMTSQSRRYESRHASVRATIAAGRLGTITNVDCDFYLAAHFGGFRDEMASVLLLDMAIHHFDLARHFTGLDPVDVWCEEYNPAGSWYRGDAAAICVFRMSNGARFTYRGSWCAEGAHTSWNGDWRFVGTEGSLRLVGDKEPPSGKVVDRANPPAFHLSLAPLETVDVTLERTGFRGGLGEMLDFLRGGATPSTECHDNVKSLAMVHAAIASSREGRRITLADLM